MADETGALAGGEGDSTPIISNTLGADAPAEYTTNQAAKALADLRWKRNQEPAAESATTATAAPELSGEDNADSPQETTSEDEAVEPAKPAIDPPKSWTKDLHEHWASLDPVLQERIVARDREDQAAIKRAFNEAADERKAVKAEREAAEKAKQQYEAQLPALMQELQSVNQSNFPDIRTMDDVVKLQNEDPFRFQAWQVHQMRLQAAKVESDRADAQRTQEKQNKRANYEAEQNKLLVELVPEMADPKKASELRDRAVNMLTTDLGLKNDQLSRWYSDETGHEILSNAGIQKLIADGLKYRDILNAPKAIAAKALPAVQRPGTSKPAGSAASERVQALDSRLTNSGSLKDAQALLLAKRSSQRRVS